MRRRALLITASTGLLSGCIGRLESYLETEQSTPDPDPSAPTPTPTPSDSDSGGNGTPAPADLTVKGISAPAEVEVSESFNLEVTIENTGGSAGTYSGVVTVTPENGEERTLAQIQIEVNPNETSTATVEDISIPLISTETYRVEGTDISTEVTATPASRAIEESFRMWNNLVISVDNVDLQSEDDEQVAFADVTVENQSQQEWLTPYSDDFMLFAGGESYGPDQSRGTDSEWYESEQLAAGTVASGYVAYTIPSDVTSDDIVIEMTQEFGQGNVVVQWA